MRIELGLLKEYLGFVLTEASIPGMTPWPADVKKISPQSANDVRDKIGPYERRMAKILGGKLTGGSASWDIEADGRKYEVKKPDHSNEIRLGGESLASFSKPRGRIEAVLRQIDGVFGEGSKKMTREAAKDVMSPEAFTVVEKFAHEDIAELLRGNLSASRMKRLEVVLQHIHQAITGTDDAVVDAKKHIVMGDEEHKVERDVDMPTYAKVGRVIGVPPSELNVTQRDLLASTLNLKAFKFPQAFIEENWTNAVTPSSVFGDVEAVIIVGSSGYKFIPRGQLDKSLVLTRAAAGRLVFKVVG
jgi:hypothetical protein